ncbi:MAG: glycosyltransferase family 2 protein [Moritella sp.]|uniref:glycosyltransferase family 2 protein n=1 Tax=Moritella sp. TaxID=78556 RepID=UPI0029B7F93C|nr:glycosyltransferase family 2 protein [Moritella sp.]MDX2319977.1 glycosyltransferase family 2 protein [Moritella sp.]
MLISICMCTYQREHVVNTLQSIAALRLPDHVGLEVIVVDNDEQGYAEKLVKDQANRMNIPVFYHQETAKNIALARNCSLDNSQGEWVAFIDDDEVADPDWLAQLLSTAQSYQADAVFGRVKSIYPSHTPQWIIESGVFERATVTNGQEVTSGATNSTLVSQAAINKHQLRFDSNYGLTGGEDADFFYRLYQHGGKLVCSNEAYVSEEVAGNRLNINYLLKRAIRIGETYTRYRIQQAPLANKLAYFSDVLLKLIILLFIVLIKLPFGQSKYAKPLLQLVDKYGKIKALFSSKTVKLYN